MKLGGVDFPPFGPAYRASGLLLHVTSLPSAYGIGDLGPSAVSWIDRLSQCGQRWWQLLPLGPTGYGNSPYQSPSSFAQNPLLISPDWLMEDELLSARDCLPPSFPRDKVDFASVTSFKNGLIDKAWANFSGGARADLRSANRNFRLEHSEWLEDYALFQVLKQKFDEAYYLEWPEELIHRKPAALDRVRRDLRNQIDQVCFTQFLMFRQSERLKAHARSKGVGLIGDVPFFVSPDSSDVWASPELFMLDENLRPRVVAGVPPDYFSAVGQLWGNPVYEWDVLKQSGYGWCIARLKSLLSQIDLIRLDHFRGFSAAWHVPAGAATAQPGEWVAGPGADFFNSAQREFSTLPFVAEDLGMITPDVHALRDEFQLPGMRILQFAFDGKPDNPYLPSNYESNTVVYTGTHDNPTTRAWFDELPEYERQRVRDFLKLPVGERCEVALALTCVAWTSPAALAIAPLQDVLNLGKEARMNVPGTVDGNWDWRCTERMLSDRAFDWLLEITKSSDRTAQAVTMQAGTTAEAISSD
jgi:4-alpha-glucanotransferase